MVHDVKQKKMGTLKRKEIKNAKCQKLKKPEGILVLKPQQSGKKNKKTSVPVLKLQYF